MEFASRRHLLSELNGEIAEKKRLRITRTLHLYNQGDWAGAPFNVLTDTLQYDYGQGVQGALLSHTHSEYLSYAQPYILLLPRESWVSSDANGNTKVALTRYEYDNYTSNPLQECPDIVGHDAAYGTTYTLRGNVTKVTTYADAQNQTGALSTASQYDIAGNVVKSFDARGDATEFDFTDRFGSPDTEAQANTTPSELTRPSPSGPLFSYAFPTKVTNTLGHRVFTQYDYYSGQAVNTEDANGTVTALRYGLNNDRLDRLAQVEQAANYPALSELHAQTTYAYDDTGHKVTVKSDLNGFGDNLLKAETFYDGLGRAVKTRRYETGTQYIETLTEYDLADGASRASNPYRPTLGESPVWTKTEYDALGRVRQVTLPDNTLAATEYVGVYTTATDQAGKKRRQKVDALGRIVRVDEPDASGSLGVFATPTQPSFYQYDTLGNVVCINQGLSQQGATPESVSSYVQHRYFKYDSLSRLTYERQVEQAGTIPTAADPLTGNASWSRRLAYDETLEGVSYTGLLTTAEDARHIVTHLYYDQLGRSNRVTYSDGTPTVTSTYDQARTGYFNVGRLTEVTTASTTSAPQTSQLYDYDRVGRAVRQRQVVDANTYGLSYSYKPGGALASETYPSGRVVSYEYDSAARLRSVSSGATVYAGQMTYKPFGGLESAALGNGTTLTMGYNDIRLQLSSITLAQGATTLQRYDYKYGRMNMTTGEVDEARNNGQIGRVEATIGTQRQWQQRLQYDSLGRLSSAGEYFGSTLQSRTYLLNYDYDAYGNRSQQQSQNQNNQVAQSWIEENAYNALTNRLASGLAYDEAGNVTRDERFRLLKLQYDANNRQQQSSSLTDTNVVESVYDGLGQRVAVKAGGNITSVMVYDVSGALVAEYGGGVSTGGTQYVMADHQGSTRVTMRGAAVNGQLVVARQDYLPFGEDVPGTAGPRAGVPGYDQGVGPRQKYAGMERDDSTGMGHTRWREFDNMSARWRAPDPYGGSMALADPQSFNRYSYVNNDPINQVDPLGLKQCGGNGTPCTQADDIDKERLVDAPSCWPRCSLPPGQRPVLNETVTVTASSEEPIEMASSAVASNVASNLLGMTIDCSKRPSLCNDLKWGVFPFSPMGGVASKGEGLLARFFTWLFRGRIAQPMVGAVTREALEIAAADTAGPTVRILTNQTGALQGGRGLYVAVGEGAEAVAGGARSGGVIYEGRVPKALIETMRTGNLAEDQAMNWVGTRVSGATMYIKAEATEFIIPFLKPVP